MSILRILRNVKNVRELRSNRGNICFHSTETSVKEKEVVKSRRFLKPINNRELEPINVNFVTTVFAGNFEKKILEYPQVFEERDITAIINHSGSVERFLQNNPKVKLNHDTLSELKALELFGLSIPQNYGGAGYNKTEISFLLECIGVEPHIARFLGCNEDYGSRLLTLFGTEEQKANYLPRLADGRSRMTLAFLETGTMIDFSNFHGYAILDTENKGHIIQANKKWVHNADLSDLILVLAKSTTLLEEEDGSLVKFNMFITEKNSPGIKVHKVVTNNFDDFSLYDIDFCDHFVPEKNILGGPETCGVTVLKSALAHSFVTDAANCCSILKQLLHGAFGFIQENKIFQKLDKGYIMTQNNLSSLTMYTYVVESVVYLLSGRYDTHYEHDLLEESILGKIIAVEMLKLAIQKYIEIVGCESFVVPGILDEALKILHYYSIMDENIEHLKMMVGGTGLCSASVLLSDKIRKLRNVPDNFPFVLKELFKTKDADKNIKLHLKIKEELHSSLQVSADLFETSLCKFLRGIEGNFIQRGQEAIENEHVIITFAEAAAYLYAVTACLSRASSAVCYDFEKCEVDVGLADKFTYIAHNKVDQLITEGIEFLKLSLMYKDVAKVTFSNKGYPAQHPLARTY